MLGSDDGYLFCIRIWFLDELWTRILKSLVFILSQNGEACPVDASGCSFAQRGWHQEIFHESHVAGGSDDVV